MYYRQQQLKKYRLAKQQQDFEKQGILKTLEAKYTHWSKKKIITQYQQAQAY